MTGSEKLQVHKVHRQLCMDKVDKRCPMQTAVMKHIYVSECRLESSINLMKAYCQGSGSSLQFVLLVAGHANLVKETLHQVYLSGSWGSIAGCCYKFPSTAARSMPCRPCCNGNIGMQRMRQTHRGMVSTHFTGSPQLRQDVAPSSWGVY